MAKSRAAKARAPAKRKGGGATAKPEPTSKRPYGLLPQRLSKTESNSDRIELLLVIGECFFPNATDVSDLSKEEKASWISFREQVLEGNKSLIQLARTVAETFGKHVDAEVEDIFERRAAELAEKEKLRRHKESLERKQRAAEEQLAKERQEAAERQNEEDLADQRQLREEREENLNSEIAKGNALLAQELKERDAELEESHKERETKRKGQRNRDGLIVGITAVSFLCTVTFSVIAALTDASVAYVFSGAFGTAAGAGFVRIMVSGETASVARP
jgi:hypothetical protein